LTAWAETGFQKPAVALVFMDRIVQMHQHGCKLPIREPKTALLVLGTGHDRDGLERNGREHHVPVRLSQKEDTPAAI
jgi:hypothetical protein